MENKHIKVYRMKDIKPVQVVYFVSEEEKYAKKMVRYSRGPIEGKNFFYRKRRCEYCERVFDGMNVIEILNLGAKLPKMCSDCCDMKNGTFNYLHLNK